MARAVLNAFEHISYQQGGLLDTMDVAIVGARGYLGRELVRLLLGHPKVEGIVPTSGRAEGTVQDMLPNLHGADVPFVAPDDARVRDCDVLFTATPAGVAAAHIEAAEEAGCRLVVDLSRDHRPQALQGEDGWTYGAADVWPVAAGTKRVANPGCYPTSSMLALHPLLEAGIVSGPVIIDGKSGVSGAGVVPRDDLHFPEMNETLRAYKPVGHDHQHEIQLIAKRHGSGAHVQFTPHLVPLTRGLLCTAYVPITGSGDDVARVYADAYADAPFVSLADEADVRHVRATNRAVVAHTTDEEHGLVVVRCAIDNLLKGGSGTAVQNMNHAFGWAPTTGLPMHAPSP